MELDAGVSTALAAIIAAVASLLSLIFTIRASKRSELRVAHRESVKPYLEQLSDDVHTVIAGVVIMRKRAALDSDVTDWQLKAKQAGSRIEDVRRKSRYVLPGLDAAFRQLALASDHVATYKKLAGTNADALVSAYQILADRVNRALRRTYRDGVPTGWWGSWRLKLAAEKVVSLWDDRPKRDAAAQPGEQIDR